MLQMIALLYFDTLEKSERYWGELVLYSELVRGLGGGGTERLGVIESVTPATCHALANSQDVVYRISSFSSYSYLVKLFP